MPSGAAAQLTLQDAVDIALADNRDVRAASIDLTAAQRSEAGAAAPSANPKVGFQAGPRFSGGTTQADIGVSFEIPIGGGTVHRRAAASEAVESSRAELAAVRLRVSTRTRLLYAAARAAEDRLALADEAEQLALETERIATRRHELGEVSALEPNFAALERAAARADVLTARREQASALRRLRTLLSLPASSPLDLGFTAAPAWPAGLSHDRATLADSATRPDLTADLRAARAADAGARAARADGAPAFSLSAGWDREGDDANVVRGGLSIELPFQRGLAATAEAERVAARAALDAEHGVLVARLEVDEALAAWDGAAEQHAFMTTDGVPLANENLRLVLRSYEAGKEDLLAVLLLQRQALATRLAAIDAELELHRAAALVERALGREIF